MKNIQNRNLFYSLAFLALTIIGYFLLWSESFYDFVGPFTNFGKIDSFIYKLSGY